MEFQINVNGMSCNHCVKSIENAIGKLDGVSTCSVSLEKSLVNVTTTGEKPTLNEIREIISDLGFEPV